MLSADLPAAVGSDHGDDVPPADVARSRRQPGGDEVARPRRAPSSTTGLPATGPGCRAAAPQHLPRRPAGDPQLGPTAPGRGRAGRRRPRRPGPGRPRRRTAGARVVVARRRAARGRPTRPPSPAAPPAARRPASSAPRRSAPTRGPCRSATAHRRHVDRSARPCRLAAASRRRAGSAAGPTAGRSARPPPAPSRQLTAAGTPVRRTTPGTVRQHGCGRPWPTDHDDLVGRGVQQPGDRGVAGGPQLVGLGGGADGDLGDNQGRMGTHRSGDQRHGTYRNGPDRHRCTGAGRPQGPIGHRMVTVSGGRFTITGSDL